MEGNPSALIGNQGYILWPLQPPSTTKIKKRKNFVGEVDKKKVVNEGKRKEQVWKEEKVSSIYLGNILLAGHNIYYLVDFMIFLHIIRPFNALKGTVSLFCPGGPEIALTFLRNEFIVKLQNSQIGPSYGRNEKKFRLLFK